MEIEESKPVEVEVQKMEEEQVNADQTIDIEKACHDWMIDPIILNNLKAEGITEFFEIQTKAIPELINCDRCGNARDICISAPTGSGKTLTYVIPIIQALMKQPIRKLRALVILPTRDLAIQVKSVFDLYISGTNLKVGLSIGKQDFIEEQLVIEGEGNGWRKHISENSIDGYSNIDILVCTPGRIADHINNNNTFTLQHLRYIVIDEVDRLLTQEYQSWISSIYSSCYKNEKGSFEYNEKENQYIIHIPTYREGGKEGITHIYDNVPLRRILCSATLPNNPQTLSKLYLTNPLYYSIKSDGRSQFSLPTSLEQFTDIMDGGYKPMYLCETLRLYIQQQKKIIIFTNSVSTTHRLYTLLTLYFPAFSGIFGEYSANISQTLRTQALQQFSNTTALVLICTDNLSRGIDIKGVDIVINYDAPVYPRTYIHRAGRTARAGAQGEVHTYIRGDQVYHFRKLVHKIHGNKMHYNTIKNEEDMKKIEEFSACLEKLKEVLKQQEMN
ncbi:hypothetical protein WA158_006013 [Blastocystis sp. Blastoise]